MSHAKPALAFFIKNALINAKLALIGNAANAPLAAFRFPIAMTWTT